MSSKSSSVFNFVCLSCDDPCTQGVDQSILDSIDQTKPLSGSIKPYQRHYIFNLGLPWPSNINDLINQNSSLNTLNKTSKQLQGRTILSAVQGLEQVYEFPARLSYDPSILESQLLNQKGTALNGLAYIFVCIHKERDARCGSLGPLILDAFKFHIKEMGLESKVFVYGVSHVGGHAFAGNCIIYHHQDSLNGHWYGRVKPSHTKQILQDHVLNGKIIQELWRGHYSG